MSATTLPDPGDASEAETLFVASASRVEADEVVPFFPQASTSLGEVQRTSRRMSGGRSEPPR